MSDDTLKPWGTRLPSGLIQELKIVCVKKGISARDFVTKAILRELGKYYKK